MSGIFGILNRVGKPVQPVLDQMGKAMALKPWYRIQSRAVETTVGLGQINIGVFCSLPQPVRSLDGRHAIVFYGEITNLVDLQQRLRSIGSRCDFTQTADLLVLLYQAFDREFVGMLEGFFALALWDGDRRRLLAANDRLGLVPLFYAHYGDCFTFSTQVKAISQQPGFKKHLNLTATAQFFRFQRLMGGNTFFEGINWLRHGSLIIHEPEQNSLRVESYWDYDRIPAENQSITFPEALEETCRLMREAMKKNLQGEHRPGIYLTGGLDSRTLLGFASRMGTRISTVTYGIPGCRDLTYAARLAKSLGTDHHPFPQENGLWIPEQAPFHLEVTEGFTTFIHSHAAITLEPARQWMDMNLSGFNGDQLLGSRVVDHFPVGYNGLDEFSYLSACFHLFNQSSVWAGITEPEEKQMYLPEISTHTRDAAYESMRAEVMSYRGFPFDRWTDYMSQINQCVHLSHFNMVHQRAFMEVRYPFCDYPLMDFVYSLPMNFRKNDRLYLAVINREIPQVTWIPRDTDDMLLTRHTTIRRLHGSWQKIKKMINHHLVNIFPEYAPYHSDPDGWVRRDLQDWVAGILFDRRTLERGILNPKFVHSIYDLHMSGNVLYSIGRLAPLVTFEMMMRRFFDQ